MSLEPNPPPKSEREEALDLIVNYNTRSVVHALIYIGDSLKEISDSLKKIAENSSGTDAKSAKSRVYGDFV